jgi:hypothetical protein
MAADTVYLAAIGPSLYIKAASVDLKQLFYDTEVTSCHCRLARPSPMVVRLMF